jgi:hypothetical protein
MWNKMNIGYLKQINVLNYENQDNKAKSVQ